MTENVIKSRGLVTTGFHLPHNPKLIERARELRKNMTPAEKKLWSSCLRDFKFRVLRQRPIDDYIVDSYCSVLRSVIEIDGESHFNEDGRSNDQYRTGILEAYGPKIIRFTNRHVMSSLESVCEQLHTLTESPLTPLAKGGTGASSPAPLVKGGRGDPDA